MSTLQITFNKIENEHAVLTWMFIRVRVGIVRTGQCFLWETTL